MKAEVKLLSSHMARHLRFCRAGAWLCLLLLAFGLSVLAGCDDGQRSKEKAETPAGKVTAVAGGQVQKDVDASGKKSDGEAQPIIGFLVDSSGLGDRGFLDSIYQGLVVSAEKHGLKLELAQLPAGEVTFEVQTAKFNELVGKGCVFIVCTSATIRKAMDSVARENPDVFFALMDTECNHHLQNECSVTCASEQGAYLAGALAAAMSQSGVLGVIGGYEIAPVMDFVLGFEAGAKKHDKNINIVTAFIEDKDASTIAWNNPELAAAIAAEMYEEQLVDVFFPVAGASGVGVFNFISEHGLYAIGVDTDQDYMVEGRILTSVLKRMDVATEHLVEKYLAGTIENKHYRFGMADGVVDISEMRYTRAILPVSVLEELQELRRWIIAGDIVPPSSRQEEK